MTIAWRREDKYAQVSECGRYSIAVCRVGGAVTYEAWRRRAHPDGPGQIRTGLATAEAARRLCEEDGNAAA